MNTYIICIECTEITVVDWSDEQKLCVTDHYRQIIIFCGTWYIRYKRTHRKILLLKKL
jgi:hypothetical protein